MRFAMVTTFYPPYHFGGDAICVYRLSQALAEQGHEVEVFHSIDAYHLQHPGNPETDFEHHPRVVLHGLRTRQPGLAALLAHQLGRPGPYAAELFHRLSRGRYDVVHFHNVSLLGGPGVLRLGQGLKLYTAHEYWLVCPTHVLFRFGREACTRRTCLACTLKAKRPPQVWRWLGWRDRCLRSIDTLLMPSRFALDRHRACGLQAPMEVLPHFVSRTDDEESATVSSPRPYFLAVGRLERLKGFQDLIPLFAKPPLSDRAELWIVGGGSWDSTLRRQAEGLCNIRFLGTVHPDELPKFYRGAVALVAPSLCYETFGMAAAEALAAGTPVVVRRHGALPELVEASDGGSCFSTETECSNALIELLDRPGLQRSLGANGRRAARVHWSRRAHLERYLGLIDRLQHSKLGSETGQRAEEPGRYG